MIKERTEEEEEPICPSGYHTDIERNNIEYCCDKLKNRDDIVLSLICESGDYTRFNWLVMCPFCHSKLLFTEDSIAVVELSEKAKC